MEWIILDDGTDCVKDVFDTLAKDIPNLRYIRLKEKKLIGGKRNILNAEAKGDIIVAMDDDDFYS
jgi:glycosyltransferase involved in cell wall biosynthesis